MSLICKMKKLMNLQAGGSKLANVRNSSYLKQKTSEYCL